VRRLGLALAATVAVSAFAPCTALAGTLDQQQTASNADIGLYNNQSFAQTFTAGISGGLDQVDLSLYKLGTPPALTVEIRNAAAGKPGTTVLASASFPASAIGTSPGLPVRFAAPPPVAAGTQYAVVAYSGGGGANAVLWRYQNTGNPYPPGGAFYSNDPLPPGGNWSPFGADADFAFKTYVTPPPDKTPPETTIGSKKIKGTTAKFTFSSNEPGSSFQCKLDKRKYKPCHSPKKYKHLSGGKHKFKVRAVDAAGNVDPVPAKKKFTI
jgi:hypothetical protein